VGAGGEGRFEGEWVFAREGEGQSGLIRRRGQVYKLGKRTGHWKMHFGGESKISGCITKKQAGAGESK